MKENGLFLNFFIQTEKIKYHRNVIFFHFPEDIFFTPTLLRPAGDLKK